MTSGSSDDDELPPEDFPLERRSSFVVRYVVTLSDYADDVHEQEQYHGWEGYLAKFRSDQT